MEKDNLNQKKENLNQEEDNRLEQDLRQMADDVTLPDSLEPEAIRKMLDERQAENRKTDHKKVQKEEKKAKKKRSWKRYLSVAAAACACVVIGIAVTANTPKGADQIETAQTLTAAKDYKEIKKCIKNYEKKVDRDNNSIARGLFSTESKADTGRAETSAVTQSSNVSDSASYSDTNVREDGVGEADIVKTDGKNLYSLCQSTVTITSLDNGSMEKLAVIEQDAERYVEEMYLQDDKLVLLGTLSEPVGDENAEDCMYYETSTYVQVYDVSDPANPTEISTLSQSGGYNTARIKEGYVYVLSGFHPYKDNVTPRDPWYIPVVQGKAMAAEDIYMPSEEYGSDYTIITAFSLNNPSEKTDSKAVFGYSGVCYVSENNIYITNDYYEDGDTTRTLIQKVAYADGKMEGIGQTKIKGTLNDSFSIDEYNGNLRLVTTIDSANAEDDVAPLLERADGTASQTIADQAEKKEAVDNDPEEQTSEDDVADEAVPGTNSLYILDDNLKIIGSIHNLAKDEQIYSARFMGDTGYFVTFQQTDPLFSVDLSNPENPVILGQLKIPGFSEYLHPYGEEKLLGIGMDVSEDGFTTEGVKLSMFNTSDPANVTEESKYTVEDSYGTDVGYNYKGVFVDTEKNLFGFITYNDGVTYHLFTYDENEGFQKILSRKMSGYESCRGLYVGNAFYLVSGNTIESYAMDTFEKIDDIVL